MAKMPSIMSHDFSMVPRAEIPRSSFDRQHGHKTTFDSGYLIPVFVDEVLPGDTFNLKMASVARLATPLFPFMDNVFLNSFFFFVPNRLLWENWQRFNGEQDNPSDSIDYVIPTITSPSGGYAASSIYDYMALPVGVAGVTHSALWLRAYNLIWNQWFRDQNLQDSVVVQTDDGPDPPSQYTLLRRGKRHDYFTSSLPWPQKGDAVNIPLGSTAPVLGIGVLGGSTTTAGPTTFYESNGSSRTYSNFFPVGPTTGAPYVGMDASAPNAFPDVYTDLSAATSATINQLRQAFQVQKLLERDARGGTRYTEIIRAHFNVVSPDARLQRPEYLGGGQTPLNLHTVPQTSSTDAQPTPQGNLSAYGLFSFGGHGFTKSFTEHGVILGLVSVRADLNYQQGMNRMWSRQTKYDFYWPALSHIGEQAVLNQEIYCVGSANPAQDAAAWGYQERYAEYRYKPSVITGEMRSSYVDTLDSWHLAQNFTSLPALNDAFIQDDPPIDRVIVVDSGPQFIGDFYFQLRCARPMPLYGVPGNIDRF